MAGKLHKMDVAVSGFLSKASKRNEPLEAFREDESFKQLSNMLETGLKKQGSWAKRNFNDAQFFSDESLSKSQFEGQFGTWLNKAMPGLSEWVSELKVYTHLHNAFLFSIQASYLRLGVMTKASGPVNFDLTNPYYIATLKDSANYLLNKSTIDETTRRQLIRTVSGAREELKTIDETADIIAQQFDDISAGRAFVIANTEANRAMSVAQGAFLSENGVKTKKWVPAGGNTCSICDGNADDGEIGVDEVFSSGDTEPPAHPSCECYLDGGMIDLDSIPLLWDGS